MNSTVNYVLSELKKGAARGLREAPLTAAAPFVAVYRLVAGTTDQLHRQAAKKARARVHQTSPRQPARQ